METRANYIAVGAFVIAILATAFVFVYWLAVTGDGTTHKRITVNFPGAVTGLVKGGAVLFNGIKVGEVVELILDQDRPGQVRAIVTVDAKAPLKTDSIAELGFQGLTGVAYVSLSGGTPGADSVFDETDPSLNARRSGVSDLMASARGLMARADNAVGSIQKVVDDIGPGIKQTVDNAAKFSDALAANSDKIETFVSDISGAAKSITSLAGRLEVLTGKADKILAAVDPESVKTVVGNVKTISEELVKASGEVDKVIADASKAANELKTFAENINGSLARVDKVIAAVDPDKISSTVDSVEKVTKLFRDSGGDIEKFIKSATSAADNIDTISKGIAGRREDIDAIIGNVRSASAKLDTSLASAEKLLASVDTDKVSRSVDSVDKVTAIFAERSGEIDKFLKDASSAADNINKVSAGVAEKTEDIKAIISDVRTAAGKLENTLEGADKLIAAIDPGKVSETVESIRSVSGRIAGRGEDIEKIIVDTRDTMSSVKTVTGDIEKKREDVLKIIEDAKQLAERLNKSSVRVESILAKVDGMLDGGDTKGLITEATEAARSIRKVAQSFEGRSDAIAAGIARFSTRGLREVETMVKEWQITARSVQRAVSKIERNPQGILFGDSGPRSYRRR